MKAAGKVGVPIQQALSGALSVLGNIHGPTAAARRLWETKTRLGARNSVVITMHDGLIVPGFGNGFYKGEPDPAWDDVSKYLLNERGDLSESLDELTAWVNHTRDQATPLLPNAAMYTAVLASDMPVPHGAELGLVVTMRTPVWMEQWAEARAEAKPMWQVEG